MGKASILKEKKRALKEKNNTVLFKLEIEVMEDQTLKVNGPINDPLLTMRILAGAMNVVVDHNHSVEKQNQDIEKRRVLKEQTRIVGLDGKPAN